MALHGSSHRCRREAGRLSPMECGVTSGLATCCPLVAKFRHLSACRGRLVGLVVKTYASRAADLGVDSRLHRVFFFFFPGSSHTSDFELALQWLPCQASGVIGSALGLVGPVSVYRDWLRFDVQLVFQCGSIENYLS